MKRLTIPDVRVDDHTTCRTMINAEAVREHAMDFYWRLKAYEDTELTPGEVKSMQEEHFSGLEMAKLHSALMELKTYQEADKAGRLAVLPCQSGEHVFALLDDQKHVWECEVEHAVLDGWRKVFAIRPLGRSKDSYYAPFGAFGKTVFLTREEAKKALAEMKEEK